MRYSVSVTTENEEQFDAALGSGRAAVIYADSGYFQADEYAGLAARAHAAGVRCGLRMPQIWRKKAGDYFEKHADAVRRAGFDIYLFRNIEGLLWFDKAGMLDRMDPEGGVHPVPYALDHSIYVWNSETLVMLKEMLELAGLGGHMPEYVTLPLELSARELSAIRPADMGGTGSPGGVSHSEKCHGITDHGTGRPGAEGSGDSCPGTKRPGPEKAGSERVGACCRDTECPGTDRTGSGSQGGGLPGIGSTAAGRRGFSRELTVYGRAPMMVSAQCVRKTVSGCDRKPGLLMLKDRTGALMPVKNCCEFCLGTIYNSVPTAIYDMHQEIRRIAPDSLRYEFTTEGADEVLAVLSGRMPDAYTRGHIRQGAK